MVVKPLLLKLDHTIHDVSDGNETIKICQKYDPEIILMDIHMPDMDGLQTFEVLRKLGFKKPNIALTANAMTNEVEEYLSLGFDAYVQKPIDRQKLISTITTFLSEEENNAIFQAESLVGEVDMSDLVDEFELSFTKELAQFQTDIDKRDIPAIHHLAHRLAGASQIFGFTVLSQKATNLEKS